MTYVPLEKLLAKKNSSVFKTTLLAAQRANELAAGAQPLTQASTTKVSTISLEEVAHGRVFYVEEPVAKGKDSE
jgi:DNA-directed RNA polymerase subunit K/omega